MSKTKKVSAIQALFQNAGWNDFESCVAGVGLTLKESGKTQLRITPDCNFAIPMAGAIFYGRSEGMTDSEIAKAFGTGVPSIFGTNGSVKEKNVGGIVLRSETSKADSSTLAKVLSDLRAKIETKTGETYPEPTVKRRGASKVSLADIAAGFGELLGE